MKLNSVFLLLPKGKAFSLLNAFPFPLNSLAVNLCFYLTETNSVFRSAARFSAAVFIKAKPVSLVFT